MQDNSGAAYHVWPAQGATRAPVWVFSDPEGYKAELRSDASVWPDATTRRPQSGNSRGSFRASGQTALASRCPCPWPSAESHHRHSPRLIGPDFGI